MVNLERLGVVLEPKQESEAKFNAGMIRQGETVHMLYRFAKTLDYADGKSLVYGANRIHYAKLDIQGNLLEDHDEQPVIAPSSPLDKGGCEDPRIVEFEGAYYVFYSAFDGEICRVGIVKTTDFVTFTKLGVIPTRQWDKDAFILPERINGKIIYIHRIEPNIEIDQFDSIEDMFDESFWEDYDQRIHDQVLLTGVERWENKKVGGSVPPIKTEEGWLMIYHGVADDRDPFCYRAGVALLDSNDPSKIVARLPYPLLEPETDYECFGDVNHVVFPQGAYQQDGWLYLSYGAADKRTALVRLRMNELMDELRHYHV